MKTITKKTILAGLLAAAALVPAEVGAIKWPACFASVFQFLGIKDPKPNDPRLQFIADISAGNSPKDAIHNLHQNHDPKHSLNIDSCYLYSWDAGIKNVGDPVIVKYSAHKFDTQEFGTQEVKSSTLFTTTKGEVTEYGFKNPKTEVSSYSKTPEFKTPRCFGEHTEQTIGKFMTATNKIKYVFIESCTNRRPDADEERKNSHIKNILKLRFPEDKKQGAKPIKE